MKKEIAIKICGITKPEDAEKAALAGAHLIGMVFTKKSPRFVDLKSAFPIADTARKAGAKVVGVFYDLTTEEMKRHIEELGLDFVQLHSPYAVMQGEYLETRKLYVRQPGMGIEDLSNFKADSDYLLYDSAEGGMGKLIDWSSLHPPVGVRWFLAGGLNPSNVAQAVHQLNPYGVDVSSGVENGVKGIKDEKLISAFIKAVQHA